MLPLVSQIQETDASLTTYCCISCFFTSIFLFSIEMIQMSDDWQDYITDPWNINDIVMQVTIWTYCLLRIFSDHLGGNFLIVKSFEFTDRHKETET